MGRKRRIWLPEAYHHVYNRGHNRQNIFQDETDMNSLFTILEMIHQQHPLSISTYCIMTNHYHLLLKTEKTSHSIVIRIMQKHYVDYYNKRYKRSGAVFDQRFKSKPFPNPTSLLTVSRYIHRNPIRTKMPMVNKMELYPYSSYINFIRKFTLLHTRFQHNRCHKMFSLSEPTNFNQLFPICRRRGGGERGELLGVTGQ